MKLIGIFVLTLIFQSCGSSHENDKEDNSLEDKVKYKKISNWHWKKALKISTDFGTLRYFCQRDGGKFNNKTVSCECSKGKAFIGFEYGKCIELSRSNHDLEGLGAIHLYKLDGSISSPIIIKDNGGSINEDYPKVFFQRGQSIRYITKNLEDFSLNEIEKFIGRTRINIHLRDLTKLGVTHVAIHGKNGKTFKDSDYILTPFKNLNSQKLNMFKDLDFGNFKRLKIKSRSDRGCMYSCTDIQLTKVGGFDLDWRRTVASGVLFKNILLAKRPNEHYPEWIFVMDANNNLDYILNVSVDENVKKYSLYSSEEALVKNWSNEILEDLDYQKYLKNDLVSVSKDQTGILCDTPIDLIIAKEKDLLDKLVLYKSNNKSIYGFYKNTKSSFLEELLAFTEEGFSFFKADNEHAYTMLDHVHYSKFTPFNLVDCLTKTKEWIHNIDTTKQSVINLSAHDDYDFNSCKDSEIVENVKLSLSKKQMWIMASGNDGFRYSKNKQTLCPQNALTGHESVLIAASSYSSNRHKDYVDIFVKNRNGQTVGSTSEASILLADFVISLKNSFPALSNKNIKRAILLSARVGGHVERESRAGGYLDRVKAFKIAKDIFDNPYMSDYELIKGHFLCSIFSCKDREAKIEHMGLEQ